MDSGFEEGMEVPVYYDPMLAKLIAYGQDREEARQRLIKAIQGMMSKGVATTLPFGLFVARHDAFISGNFDTHFVPNYFTSDSIADMREPTARAAGILAAYSIIRMDCASS